MRKTKSACFWWSGTRPGLSFGREEHKLGMHGTSTRRVILNDVQVPTENAFGIGQGHYAAFCALNMGRFKLEAGAVGGLKYLLSVCAKYASQRKTFGQPIASYGLIQHKLAEMAARTFALESMVYRLAGDMERAFATIVPDAPDAALAAISSRFGRIRHRVQHRENNRLGNVFQCMADEAIQIHGGIWLHGRIPGRPRRGAISDCCALAKAQMKSFAWRLSTFSCAATKPVACRFSPLLRQVCRKLLPLPNRCKACGGRRNISNCWAVTMLQTAQNDSES